MSEEALEGVEIDADFLRVKINHCQPIELAALSGSMGALSGMFGRFADASGYQINDDRVRLYVTKVEAGSIILDLQAYAQNLQLFAQDLAIIKNFSQAFHGLIDFCKGSASADSAKIDKKDAQDAIKLLDPIAQDTGSSMTISHCNTVNVVNNITINSLEANAGQNRLKNLIAKSKAEVVGLYKEVLFYFYQARDAVGGQAGDKGIIETISKKPVKTYLPDALKEGLISDALFTKAYVVDVEVQTIGDQPKLYKILRVIESFDKD